MRRVVVAISVLAVVAAGCSGGSGEDCGEIADEGIDLLQDFVDEVDEMGADELAAAVGDADFITDLEDRADALDERAAAAGCSEERMAELLDERAGDLSADSEFGQTIVDLILTDQFFTTE